MSSEDQSTTSVYNRLCYICLEVLKDPTTLECNHSFCRKCLKNYISYSSCHNIKDLFTMLRGEGANDSLRIKPKLNVNRKHDSVDKGTQKCRNSGDGRKISTESSPSQLQRIESINTTSLPGQSGVYFYLKISSPSSENLSQQDSSSQINEPLLHQQQVQKQQIIFTESSTKNTFTEIPNTNFIPHNLSLPNKQSSPSNSSSSNPPFHCPVCYKTFSTSPLLTNQITKSSSESRFKESNSDLLKCESCQNTTEFFCNKCNINLCLLCRQQHDSMALFKEHPVVYVVSKGNGDVLICFKHNKKACTYFCLNCKTALCVLCVMRHQVECMTERANQKENVKDEEEINLQIATNKNEIEDISDKCSQSISNPQTTTQSHYYYQQPKHQPVKHAHTDARDVNSIIKLRDAIRNVRENLKSVLNLLASQLNRMKGKLNYFSSEPFYRQNHISSKITHFPHKKSFCYISDDLTDLAIKNELSTFNKLANILKHPKNESSKLNTVLRKFKNKLKQSDEIKQLNVLKIPMAQHQELVPGMTPLHSDDSTDSDTQEEQVSWSSSTSNKHILSGFRKKFQKGFFHSHKNGLNTQADSKSTDNSGSVDSLEGDEKKMLWKCEMAISTYQKLLSISTNALESSQAKRLYSVYEDLSDRVRVVVESELVTMDRELDNMFIKRQQRAVDSSSGSNLSRTARVSDGDSLMDGWLDVPSMEVSQSPTTSPNLLARPFQLWKYEKSKNDYEGTSIPCDLAYLEREGCVVVAEYDNVNNRNNRLQLIDASTGCLRTSLMEGQIHPLGMALSRDQQHLVVSDCKSKRVKIISLATGTVMMEMGKGQFGWPYGVSVNGRGVVVVSDAFNDCILLFSPDGKKIRSFGSTGSQVDQFRNPYHLASDSRERIYVSDSGNNCVKVFDINGNFDFIANDASRRYSTAGSEGTTERKRRKLKGPRGVAVDGRANIFVADDHNRVSMFDSQGSFTRFALTEEDMVRYPEAVCYCLDGSLIISEWSPGNLFSVKKFSLYNKGV